MSKIDSHNLQEEPHSFGQWLLCHRRTLQILVVFAITLGFGLGFSTKNLSLFVPTIGVYENLSTNITVTTIQDTLDAHSGACIGLLIDDLPGADGRVSLREAICASNNTKLVDAIILSRGTYILSRIGSDEDSNNTGDLDITYGVTIVGIGPLDTFVDSNGIDRVFHIQSQVFVNITGVTIQNGHAPDGANGDYGDQIGGAGGPGAPGGGILNAGNLNLTNCALRNNRSGNGGAGGDANVGRGGNGAPGGDGGGIYNEHGSKLYVQDCTIVHNVAGGGGFAGIANSGSSGCAAKGGMGGGLLNSVNATMELKTSSVNDNQSGAGGTDYYYSGCGGGVGGSGGGIVNAGTLRLGDTLVADNTAAEGGSNQQGQGSFEGGKGGGIFNTAEATLIAENSEIRSNQAGSTASDDFFSGGGIANEGVFTLINSRLVNNSAGPGLSTHDGGSAGGWGGGLDNKGDALLLRSTVANNKAGDGGSGRTAGTGGSGGGIHNGGVMRVFNSTISQNNAGKGGENVAWGPVQSGSGGGIANDGTLKVMNSTISSNATAGGGPGRDGFVPGGSGGGIYTIGLMDMENSTVAENLAAVATAGRGGGLLVSGGIVRLRNTILGNSRDGSGERDCVHEGGSFVSLGYNLAEKPGTCTFGGGFDKQNLDPRLGPLANNGGSTRTFALLPGSPAIDVGSCTDIGGAIVSVDQRDLRRPVDGTDDGASYCDIGAIEMLANLPLSTVAAYHASSSPTLDGDLSEWPNLPWTVVDAETAASIFGIAPSTFDLTAAVRSLWTSSALYFAFQITDNKLINDSHEFWHDDEIELGMDGQYDYRGNGPDDHQFTVNSDGRKTDRGNASNSFESQVRTRIDGWDAEIAIPISALQTGTLTAGRKFGFNLGVIDDDNGGDNDSHLYLESDDTYAVNANWGMLQLRAEAISLVVPPVTTPTPTGNTETLQQGWQGYLGSEDAKINQWEPMTNYGSSSSIGLRNKDVVASLLRFDLSGLPAGIEPYRAILSLRSFSRSNTQQLGASVFPLLRPWNEMQSTWNRAQSGVPWQVTGANGPNDRGQTSIAEQSVKSISTWHSFDITKVVKSWLSGSSANYGLIIKALNDQLVAYDFLSSESAESAYHPELIISYWNPTATASPTPTSSPTFAPTPTSTPTITPSATLTRTSTPSATSLPSATATPSATWTPTETTTPTPTPSPTTIPAMIKGYAWHDLNGNGSRETNEPGLIGIKVRLYFDGSQIGETTTNGNGSYDFVSIEPGDYLLVEVQPSWLLFSTTPQQVDVTVNAGEYVTVNFGDWNGMSVWLPISLTP